VLVVVSEQGVIEINGVGANSGSERTAVLSLGQADRLKAARLLTTLLDECERSTESRAIVPEPDRHLEDVDDLLTRMLVPDRRGFVADLDAVLDDLPSRSAQILPLQIDPRDPGYLGLLCCCGFRPVVLITSLL
jgi:hypothetical protein